MTGLRVRPITAGVLVTAIGIASLSLRAKQS
jgi:hypothetical protein